MEHSNPPTIAITGGTGLIGTRLVESLAAHVAGTGNNLRILSRTLHPDHPGITHIQGDLANIESLAEWLHGASSVVHLAGVAHTTLRTPEDRERARKANVDGTRNILLAAQHAGVSRVIIASTAHVYTGQQGLSLHENSPTTADSLYAEMKLEAEALAQQAFRNGLNVVIIRPCLVYGPGVRFNLHTLMRAVQRGYYFHISAMNPLRSFASVDTVAAAIQHLLYNGEPGNAYNIADRTPVHLVEWVNHLSALMHVRNPRTLPMALLKSLAALLTPAAKAGLPIPLTTESLAKLTASFTLDVSKLAATGFQWPDTTDSVIAEMVRSFQQAAS